MKPTYGRVSRYGIVAFASSLDQIGPFARDARDAAALLHAVAGRDDRDSTSSPEPVPATLTALPSGDDEAAGALRGKRLGLPREYFVAGMEPGVEARVREAVAALEAAGATVEEVSLPHTDYGLATYYIVAPAEASANLARYDGIRYRAAARRRRRPGQLPRHPRPGLRCRGQAPDHARDVRAVGRLLRRLLPQGAEGAHADQGRLRRAVGAGLRCPRRADLADRRVPPRRPAGRPRLDVPVGRVHAAGQHGRAARRLDPVRPVGRAAGGSPAHRCRLVGGGAARPGARLRGDHRQRRLADDRADGPGERRGPSGPDPGRSDGRPAGRCRSARSGARRLRSARTRCRTLVADDDDRREPPHPAVRARPVRARPQSCRRRASAASSTSRPRWTTSSAWGWGSPTSTRRGSSSKPASRACARAGRTTPATSGRSSCDGRSPATSRHATASPTIRRPRSWSRSAPRRRWTSRSGRRAIRVTR